MRKKEAGDKKIPEEFGCLTICALRYCYGRMSYMPSLIVDATKANWKFLSKNDKTIILKDLAYEIENSKLGMDCDRKMWLQFYDWMLNQEKDNDKT